MVFRHRRLALVNLFFFNGRTGQFTNTSYHKGWVRILCSLPFAPYIIKSLVGGEVGVKWGRERRNPRAPPLGGDSLFQGPPLSLHEACLKIISDS